MKTAANTHPFLLLSNDALPGIDPLLDDYLEQLVAPLVGIIPYHERARLKSETAFHLERLREDFLIEGSPLEEASAKAIRAYGPVRRVSDEFLQSWFKKQARGPLSEAIGHANAVALGTFGLAQLLCVIAFQMRVYLPGESVFRYAIRPAVFNEVFSPNLPIPELTPLYIFMLAAMLFSPIMAGAFVGSRVPVRAAKASLAGILPCIVYSFVMGVIMLPMKEMLLLAVFQVVFWLPVGAFSAHVASLVARARLGGRG